MVDLFFFLQATPAGNGFAGFLPIILIIIVFYFFMIRPQINRQREEEKFRSEIKKGDKVVTIGGIHGKVSSIQEKKITLEISENTRIVIDTHAISKEKSIQHSKQS